MVEDVEELRAEFQAFSFPRKRKVLNHRKVGVHEVWSVDRSAGGVAEFPIRRLGKGALVKPMRQRAAWATRSAAARCWIADLVRTDEAVAAVVERRARGVIGVVNENRE